MNVLELKLKDKNILIKGIALPMPLQISLQKRGKTVVNHRYVEEQKELQVLCSTCNQWHPVYKFEGGAWIDINQTYKLCNAGKEGAYFDTYCSQCYENKRNKDNGKTVVTGGIKEEKVTKSVDEGKFLPWSEKAGGIQQTIFLSPELDMYLKLYGVFNNKKKNELINQIIAEFKEKHPINL